ncbi:glycosyltransferase [Colwellia piezophila]|uniref:glycosyltransferase n=1 Tax=Colwellia piezophila TaxID=211668 RepID=UPI000370AE94|nr:glycosyltransferase [Colwellia piezophila]
MIKYSIVVPVYNTHKEVKNIIGWFESTCKNRNDIELIIIDDGSACKLVLSEIQHLTYVYKQNGGVSSARNAGIKLAVGDYILFLDSDDAYTEDIFDVLDAKLQTDIDLLVFSYSRVYPDFVKTVINQVGLYTQEDFIKAYCIKEIKLHIASCVYKRVSLQSNKIHFDEDVSYSEDVLFSINFMFTAKKIQVIDDELFFYNMREGSAINSPFGPKTVSNFIALREIKCKRECFDDKYINYFVNSCYANLLINLYRQKTTETSVTDAFLAFKSNVTGPCVIRLSTIGIAVIGIRLLTKLPSGIWKFAIKKWLLV